MAAAVIACGCDATDLTVTSEPPPAAPSAPTPAGAAPAPTTTGTPLAFDHVFTIVLENHASGEILGNADAPYITSLARTYANATSYSAVAHPSEPNYLALAAGDSFGIKDDQRHTLSASLVTDLVDAAGKSWKAYMQSLPSGTPEADVYPYAVKHDPFISFEHVRLNGSERAKVVPFAQLSTDLTAGAAPNYAFITPDLMDDMHDGSVSRGDSFVQRAVEAIQASSAWANERTLIVIVFDEDDGSGVNQVPCIFVAKNAAPGDHPNRANHYSLLATIEQGLGLGNLGRNDASAAPMTWMFE